MSAPRIAHPSPRHAPEAHADVCLLLEGTYPYVRGGVSSWVRQLIENVPELSFSIVFLGASSEPGRALAFDLPGNLVHLEVHALLDPDTDPAPAPARARRGLRPDARAATCPHVGGDRFAASEALHARLVDADAPGGAPLDGDAAALATALLAGPARIVEHELRHGRRAWESLLGTYRDAPDDLDFNHWFWTVRGMHAPLFALARIAADPPKASLYHAVSTGYAGLLGAMLKCRTDRPYLVSEHGIYTKERELDLGQVAWIPEAADPFGLGAGEEMGHLRALWIRFFRSLGRLSYASADRVFTLHEGNRRRQVADGARPERIEIVPNGVDVARFAAVRRAADAPVPPVIALIGRVVPIKDIKTFVRMMRVVRARLPDAEGWLVGPQDEDPAYTDECKRLVASLELEGAVRFLGFRKPEEIFPRVGLQVLTSVSEGQPLVTLEGFAAGIPTVTTDVGSCAELVHGLGDADRALGAAGAVVPIADPAAFADAAVRLLGDVDAWRSARDAAIARVERHYDERDMVRRYRDVWREALAGASPEPRDEAA